MEYVLLEELRRIFQQGIRDFNEAAKRLKVPLSLVQRTFADGVLKGYWKVADGQLLIKLSPDNSTERHPSSSPSGRGSGKATAA